MYVSLIHGLGKRKHMIQSSDTQSDYRWDVNMSNASRRSSFGFQSMSFLGLVGVEDKKYDSCALQQDVGKIEILIHDTESWLYRDV